MVIILYISTFPLLEIYRLILFPGIRLFEVESRACKFSGAFSGEREAGIRAGLRERKKRRDGRKGACGKGGGVERDSVS